MMDFLKKNWIWVVVAVLAIYLFINYRKRKQAEDKAVTLFNRLNSMTAQAKQGQAYSDEKISLIKLVDNSTEKERQILADLLNGTISVFQVAEQEKDKEKAKKDFAGNIASMQNGLIAKHGKENVVKFKVKMDKYGFDI